EDSTVEYTVNNGFPNTDGENTYYAIPPNAEDCYFEFVIEVSIVDSTPNTENVAYCLNEQAIPLEATLTNPEYNLYFYNQETGGNVQGSIIPDTDVAGEFSYWVAEGPTPQCTGDRIEII